MNIIEYVSQSTDSFAARPFGEVDSLVLSQAAYLRVGEYEGVRLCDLYDLVKDRMASIAPARTQENEALLAAFGRSVRYEEVRLVAQNTVFDVGSSCQFSATLFAIGDLYYFACRGTDGTLVGWKEDLDLMYKEDIAAQTHALRWLNRMTGKRLIVGGHSKGGNLAVYAAAFCDRAVQDNIVAVYDHDGPGFMPTVLTRDGYRRILPRVHKTVPEMCVFGHMMVDDVTYTIIKSDGNNICQHLSFTWQCTPEGYFVLGEGLTVGSQIVRDICDSIVPSMTIEERETFVTIVYEALRHADVDKVGDIASVKAVVKALQYNRSLPKPLREKMGHCVHLFLSAAWGSSVAVTEEYVTTTVNEWRVRRQEKKAGKSASREVKLQERATEVEPDCAPDETTALPLVSADLANPDDTEN